MTDEQAQGWYWLGGGVAGALGVALLPGVLQAGFAVAGAWIVSLPVLGFLVVRLTVGGGARGELASHPAGPPALRGARGHTLVPAAAGVSIGVLLLVAACWGWVWREVCMDVTWILLIGAGLAALRHWRWVFVLPLVPLAGVLIALAGGENAVAPAMLGAGFGVACVLHGVARLRTPPARNP